MAQCKLTAQELSLAAFSPIIGVLCSPTANSSCQKNNLNFAEMLQPFCQLTIDGQIRDPGSGSSSQILNVRSLRLTSRDAHARPPQTTLARRLLNESVSESICERQTLVRSAGVDLEIPAYVPWFDNWQETFLHVQYPFDHEFTRHYLACLLVVAAHEPSPFEEFQKLAAELQEMQAATNKAPKWFPDLFKYYIILEDQSEIAQVKSEEILHSLRAVHSPKHCQILRINSRRPDPISNEAEPDPWNQFLGRREEINSDSTDWSGEGIASTVPIFSSDLHPLSPDTPGQPPAPPGALVHGAWLSQEDRDKISQMLKTFCIDGLLPHLENQLQTLSEGVANRKGVSRSLLSATKRWFGGPKPGTVGATPPASAVAYAPDAAELQLRRLGDFWFLLGQWSQAFQAYHAAKREFGAEQAWLHYAGALEMAALSSFLQGEASAQRKAQEYMEEAIATYVHWCRMPALATRATLLSTAWLRAKGQHGEAARQLLRMSGEDSDLRSALLLEQAAYCFLAGTPMQLPRKYAFHAVLAGHRFGKAGQRRHSLRLYRQALQVYRCDGWALAHDHLHFTAGRHAASLRELELAAQSFEKLLAGTSNQPPSQQALFLREYLTTHLELKAECPRLPLPILDQISVRVLVGDPPTEIQNGNISASDVSLTDASPTDPLWSRLEEIAVSEAQGTSPMVFKPTVRLFGPGTNSGINIARSVVNESVSVSVRATNPLGVPLVLQKLSLRWGFLPSSSIENKENWLETSGPVKSEEVNEVILPPKSSSILHAKLIPGAAGKLRLTGFRYNIMSAELESGDNSEPLSLAGHQNLNEPVPQVQVIAAAPRLEITLCEVPHRLLNGEVLRLPLRLSNEGTLSIDRILVVGPSRLFCFEEEPSSTQPDGSYVVKTLRLPSDILHAKQRFSTVLWLRPSSQVPELRLLFYYETKENEFTGYRLVRHQWTWPVLDGVNVTATCQTASESPAFVLRLNNENDAAQVSALGLSLQSDQLRLSSNATPAATAAAAASLGPGQVLHLVAHARRRPPDDPEPPISHLQLGIKSQDSNSNGNGRPFTSFITTSPALVVRWQATLIEPSGTPRIVLGQHHLSLSELCGPTLGPNSVSTLDTLEQLEALKHQAICSLKHAHRVQHDFKQTRICVVPVHVTVSSRSRTPICVRIHTWRHSSSSDDLQPRINRLSLHGDPSLHHQQQLYSPRCSNQLAWVGHAGAHVTLQPQASHELNMNVTVGSPGVYDVGSRLEIWVRGPDDPERSAVLQAWRIESSLIVTASGQ